MTTNLIRRLESAEEGSRELETDIAVAIGYKEHDINIEEFLLRLPAFKKQELTTHQLVGHWKFPKFTRSIDAALTMGRPEWAWEMRFYEPSLKLGGWAMLSKPDGMIVYSAKATTLALAICAAILKALEEPHG